MPIIVLDGLNDSRIEPFQHVGAPSELVRRGLFVAEGRLVVERLIGLSLGSTRYVIESLLLSDTAFSALRPAVDRVSEVPTYVCPAGAFTQLAGLNLHRGCLALARRPPHAEVDEVIRGARLVVVLEAIGNPDNIGGIFRNAAAFGVDAVLLSPGCADPLYRKAIRTSMGAVLGVPYTTVADWPAGLDSLSRKGFTLLALTPRLPSLSLDDWVSGVTTTGAPVALLMGAEGAGLTSLAQEQANVRIRIPTTDAVDSLNVAVACGIVLSRLRPSARLRPSV